MNQFKKSEAQVTKECTDLLKVKQIVHWRNNVLDGKFQCYKEKKWRHVKNGIKGMGDWSFVLNDGSGRTVFLELKATGKKQSQDQKDFESDCVKRNVLYFCIDNVNDLLEILSMFDM